MHNLAEMYVTTPEAARMLGIHPVAMAQLARKGTVAAEKIANRWLFSRCLIEEVAKTYTPKRGRPKKKSRYSRCSRDEGSNLRQGIH